MRRARQMSLGIASIAASVLLVSAPATPAAQYSGTITGSFDGPVLSGAFLRRDSHEPVARDNAGTARHSGVGTATISWGGADDGCGAGSTLTFSGDSFKDVAPDQVFRLGTLTFANGPGEPASLIFGFELQLTAGEDVAPFAGPVAIVSTQNANVDRIADADVLSFDFGAPSTLAGFEGTSVTAIVYGSIAADGTLGVTSIGLAPGESQHGCVDDASLLAARGPCSGCGDLCGTVASLFSQPPCGTEQLPGVLSDRIRRATGSLDQGATAKTTQQATRAVRLAMRQLRSSAAWARRAAKRREVSPECAGAIGAAVANAETTAAPQLRPASR